MMGKEFLVVVLFCHLLINGVYAAAASSDLFVDSNKAELEEFLRNCVRGEFRSPAEPLDDVSFTLKGKDDFRSVDLTFKIEAGSPFGPSCTLIWDDWFQMMGNMRSHISMTGTETERGMYMDGIYGNNVQRLEEPTEIKIDIYQKPTWHWELVTLYPSNLVSARFIRKFIVQGMKMHSEIVGQPVFLRLQDMSSIRELYWLEKSEGKTYFQAVWNLEYECILSRMDHEQKAAFEAHARDKMHSSIAAGALRDTSFDSIKRPQTMTDPLFHFADIFQEELSRWLQTKSEFEKKTLTIREALDDFIPMWKTEKYTENQHQILAQNTFMYFFRHDQEFQALATLVVQGFDDTCHVMRGVPKLDGLLEQQRIEYIYHGPLAPRTPSDTPGMTPQISAATSVEASSPRSRPDTETFGDAAGESDEQKSKIWVGGLPKDTPESDVSPLFEKFGKIVHINIRASKTDTFAFIEFENEESARRAITEMKKGSFKGNPIKVNWAKADYALPIQEMSSMDLQGPSSLEEQDDPFKIWVSRLPKMIRERELKDAFEKYGKVTSITVRTSRRGDDTFAFITFDDEAAALDAVREMDESNFKGGKIKVKFGDASKSKMPEPGSSAEDLSELQALQGVKPTPDEDPKTLFVRGLPTTVKETDLAELFGSFGKIDDIRLNFKGLLRGESIFAFISYDDDTAAMNAIAALDKTSIIDKMIRVNFAKLEVEKGKTAASPLTSPLSTPAWQQQLVEGARAISPEELPPPAVSSKAESRPVKGSLPLLSGSPSSPSASTIWVGGLSKLPITREKDLREAFKKFGAIANVNLRAHGKFCFAFITFEDEEAASKAMQEMDKTLFKGRKIAVRPAQPEKDPGEGSGSTEGASLFSFGNPWSPDAGDEGSDDGGPQSDGDDKLKVWVGGLSNSYVGENELRRLFGKYGTVVAVYIRSSKHDRFAFVKFDKESSAAAAIRELDQTYFKDAKITLKYAKLRQTSVAESSISTEVELQSQIQQENEENASSSIADIPASEVSYGTLTIILSLVFLIQSVLYLLYLFFPKEPIGDYYEEL